jgi:hypothetical protein
VILADQTELRGAKCGTLHSYNKLKCRCADCRAANRAYALEYRLRHRKPKPPPPPAEGIGKLICTICDRPFAEHSLTEACFRV